MRLRPLIVVAALIGADYLVWTLFASANSPLAVIAGLALPPLAIVLLWLLVTAVLRTLNRPRLAAPSPQTRPARPRGVRRITRPIRAIGAVARGGRGRGKPAASSAGESSRIAA